MEENPYIKRIEEVFNSDGKKIVDQFILAGLILTVFERLKVFIVEHVDGFFSNRIWIDGGKLNFERGEEFKELIREKGNNEQGQHANKVFRAAARWFSELNAIDSDELDHIEKIYILRNDISHELLGIICDPKKQQISLYDVLKIFEIYSKLTKWWAFNIELATDPDMFGDEIESIDINNIENVEAILLREIIRKTLFTNEEWKEIIKDIDANNAG